MARNTNTTASLNKKQVTDTELQKQLGDAKRKLEGEKLVKVSIPEQFKKHIGETQFVSVNGVFVNIPVDGKEYEIPETLAKHLKEALNKLTI